MFTGTSSVQQKAHEVLDLTSFCPKSCNEDDQASWQSITSLWIQTLWKRITKLIQSPIWCMTGLQRSNTRHIHEFLMQINGDTVSSSTLCQLNHKRFLPSQDLLRTGKKTMGRSRGHNMYSWPVSSSHGLEQKQTYGKTSSTHKLIHLHLNLQHFYYLYPSLETS